MKMNKSVICTKDTLALNTKLKNGESRVTTKAVDPDRRPRMRIATLTQIVTGNETLIIKYRL